MKRCPLCGQRFPDDGNFCPMDAGRLVPEVEAPAASPDAGATVRDLIYGGRFRVGRRLAGGSTGEIFEATDGQSGQTVAIKMVAHKTFSSPLALDRTQRELRQLAKVNSERVLKVLDTGKADQGLWIAMELFGGKSLRDVALAGPLPPAQASQIVLGIGEALLEAQKVGVVHRDVAPNNVLIDDQGHVKVTDFSIAPPISEKVSGTAEFLSPEQAEGKPIDQRSNIYSLGAIFYFLLTGTPPFHGSAQDVIRQHLQGDLEAPSKRRAGLPVECDKVIVKAMEKQSSRRHLTLRQFLSEVELASGGGQTGVPSPTVSSPTVPAAASVFADVPAAMQGGFVPTAPPDGRTVVPGAFMQSGPVPPPAAPSSAAGGMAFSAPSPAPAPRAEEASVSPVPVVVPTPSKAAAVPTSTPNAETVPVVMSPAAQAPAPSPAPFPAPSPAPSPVSPPQPAPAVAQAKKPMAKPQPKGKQFRETMWFKKGEVRAAAAQAASRDEAAADQIAADEARTGDAKVLADAYQDDGSVAAGERKKYSLRTGHTQMNMKAVQVDRPVAGQGMSERELAAEMNEGGKALSKIVVAVVVIVVLIGGIIFAAKIFAKSQGKPAAGAHAKTSLLVPGRAPAPPA